MKKVLSLVLALLMVLALAACSAPAESTPADDGGAAAQTPADDGGDAAEEPAAEGEPIEISVRGLPKETDTAGKQIMEARLATMKEKYPNVTVEVVDFPYDVNTFLPKAASGQLPTLYNTFFTEANKIISQGFALDITDLMNEWGYTDKVNPAYLELISRDGKIYGLPSSGYALGMWYNVEMFKAAGLVDENGNPTYPTNSTELAEMAVKIKEATGYKAYFFPTKNNQGGWMFTQLVWSFGGDMEQYDEANDTYTAIFNSQEAVDALQWLKDMRWKYDVVQDNILCDTTEAHKLFALDQIAIAQMAQDQLNNSVTNYNGDITHFGMGTIVPGDNDKGKSIGLLGGTFEVIAPNATAEQANACFQWMELEGTTPNLTEETLQSFADNAMVDQENGKLVGVLGLPAWTDPDYISQRKEAIADYVTVDLDLYKQYTDACENGTYELHAEPPVYCQEMYKILDSCVQAVLTDENADPQALLDKAVEDFQRDYLDKYNSGAEAQ